MKRLSEKTHALLMQLYQPPSLIKRLIGQTIEAVPLIEEIAEQNEPAAIPYLISYLRGRSSNAMVAASDAIHQLMCLVPSQELYSLGYNLRFMSDWIFPAWWRGFRPGDLADVPKSKASCPSVWGLFSLHQNGYVREAAVRHLVSLNDGQEVRYLLIRMNDWVAQIRSIARESVESRLHAGPFEPFAQNMALVLQLLEFRRNDLSGVVEAIMDRLIEPQNERYLLELIVGDNRLVRHRVFQEAIKRPGPHVRNLIAAGLDSADAFERLLAVRHSAQALQGDELKEVLARKANDPCMPVRREALIIRIDTFPDTAIPPLEEALFDKSYSQRELARFYLKKLGRDNCAIQYRIAVEEAHHLPEAISGLGESGTSHDIQFVEPYLRSLLRRHRLAAVVALDRLADKEAVEPFLDRLTDDSPKVTRAAQKALSARPSVLNPELIWNIFQNAGHRHTKIACIDVLGDVEVWTGLSYLIEAASDPDEDTALRAEQVVRRRYNRVFTSPSPEARKRLIDSLTKCEESLKPGLRKLLQEWLRGLLGRRG